MATTWGKTCSKAKKEFNFSRATQWHEGCVVTFNDKNCKVSKGSLVVEKGVKVVTLYLCTGHIVPSTYIISEENEHSGTITIVE